VAARPRWSVCFAVRLAAWLALWLTCAGNPAWAQGSGKLDLRIPTAENGIVTAVRDAPTYSESMPARKTVTPPALTPPAKSSYAGQGAPLVGPVIYLPTGPGADPNGGWHYGAAGTPEMQRWMSDGVEVSVRMDDGEQRTFRPSEPSRFHVGQRVTLLSGDIEPLR
jgi:hypothetical protein